MSVAKSIYCTIRRTEAEGVLGRSALGSSVNDVMDLAAMMIVLRGIGTLEIQKIR